MDSSGPVWGGMAQVGNEQSPLQSLVVLTHAHFSQTTHWGIKELKGDPGLILKVQGLSPGAWLWLPAFLGIRASEGRHTLTVVTSPIDVDASAIVAGKLSQGEAGGIGCQGESIAE